MKLGLPNVPLHLPLLALLIGATLACSLATACDPPAAGAEQVESGVVRVLVVYYSRSGNTQRMAGAVVKGAGKVSGIEAVAKSIETVTKADLQAAHAIALGCPTYFANIPGKMKTAIDDWNWKWKVDFTDKIGGAFSTGGGQTGGKEFVVVSLLLYMINNRMVVAGPLYQDPEGEDIWGEAGASAMTGPIDPGVEADELDAAMRLGDRLARLAKRLHGN